jgi:hypothetical protein
MNKIKHLDCVCKSFDHIMRIWWDKEYEEYSIEYKLEKFPFSKSLNKYWTFYPNQPFKNFVTSLSRRYYIITDYFTCIWWAIKGKPYWFCASTELGPDEAQKLYKFLAETLNQSTASLKGDDTEVV